MTDATRFMGVDVQIRRGCTWAVLDASAKCVDAGWAPTGEPQDVVSYLKHVASQHSLGDPQRLEVGIDAPRMPLASRRIWSWKRGRWFRGDKGLAGRHCELALNSTRVATPQWTPVETGAAPWMQLGFMLFRELSTIAIVREVFPSASYALLDEDQSAEATVRLAGLKRGVKDMVDAYVAAFTIREFFGGRGQAVGGGDGFGEIVLPRPLKPWSGVLVWPESNVQEALELGVETKGLITCSSKARRLADGSWEIWAELESVGDPDVASDDLTRGVRSARDFMRAYVRCGDDFGFELPWEYLEDVLPDIARIDPLMAAGLAPHLSGPADS